MRPRGHLIAAVAVVLVGAGVFLAWAPRWGRSAGPSEDAAHASPAPAVLGAQATSLSRQPRISPRAPVAFSSATVNPSMAVTATAAVPLPSRREPAPAAAQPRPRASSTTRASPPQPSARLQLVTRRLEPALVGAPYQATLIARGGAPPYRWSVAEGLLPQGLRLDETRGILYGVPAHLEAASCTLMVEDRSRQRATRRLTITVLEQMLPPLVEDHTGSSFTLLTTSLPDGTVGLAYAAQLRAQGGAPPYAWSVATGALPEGLSLDPILGVLAGVPVREGIFPFQIIARDARGTTAEERFTVQIVTSPLYLTTGSLAPGVVGQFYAQRLDAQGGAPPYSWSLVAGALPEGVALREAGQVEGMPLKAGMSVCRLMVTDQRGASDAAEFQLMITGGVLTIATKTVPDGTVGMSYYAALEAQGGVPPYRWSSATTMPAGLALDALSGTLAGQPTAAAQTMLDLLVTDQAQQIARASVPLLIRGAPLRITTTVLEEGRSGQFYHAAFSAEGGQPPYAWQLLEGRVPRAVVLSRDGILSGVVEEPGEFPFTAQVTDAAGAVAHGSFRLLIPLAPLRILTTDLPDARAHAPYTATLEAEGGVPPYHWRLSAGALPAGLTLDPLAATLSGTPSAAGTFEFTVEVTDTASTVATQPLSLRVPAEPLAVVTVSLPNGRAEDAYEATLMAEGGTPPYTWRISEGGLPDGLLLDAANGTIAGTPTRGARMTFTAQVTDATRTTASGPVSLFIAGPPLSLVTATVPDATAGPAQGMVQNEGDVPLYTVTLQAVGGVPPYTWSVVEGALPEGIRLSPDGVLSGTPTRAGATTVRLQVKDQDDAVVSRLFTITVRPQALKIITESLPRGAVGQAYAETLAAIGGTPPYRWSLEGGALPDGLTLHEAGALSGTPQTSGPSSFVIHVSDEAQASATKPFTLEIDGPAIPPVTDLIAAPSDGKVGLAWRNPDAAAYDHTVIVRRTDRFPAGPEDDAVIYSGTETQFVDTGLLNGAISYYAAFAIDRQGRSGEAADGSRAQAIPQAVEIVGGPADPYADAVASFNPLHSNPFGNGSMPSIVLGTPRGGGTAQGSLDVVSLGCGVNADGGASAPYGGSVTLEFSNNIIVDGPGADFTVFENAFYQGGDPQKRFMEPAVVLVSQDGQTFYRFPFDYVPHFTPGGQVDFKNPFSYSDGFAGINPVFSNLGSPDPTNPSVSGGDSFDLAALPGQPLRWARFVRIMGAGDQWLTDVNGDLVRHVNDPLMRACERTASNAGFDLDAVAAVHY